MDEITGIGTALSAAAGGAGAGGALLALMRQWMRRLHDENKELKKEVDDLRDVRIARLEGTVQKLADVCAQCRAEHRIDNMEPTMRRVSDKLDGLAESMATMGAKIAEMDRRQERMSASIVRHVEAHAKGRGTGVDV
jgi:phage shock protein A